MKNLSLTLVALLLLVSSGCKKEKNLTTEISGRVLEAGSLQPVASDSLRIRIIDGFPCGYPCLSSAESELVAEIDVLNGRYSHSFEAKDESYHWIRVVDLAEDKYYDYPSFEIYPGQEQVRDILLYRKTDLIINFYDKDVYPNLKEVMVGGIDRYGLSTQRFGADTVSFPYQTKLPVTAGQTYEVELIIYYGNNDSQAFQFTEDIPYDKTRSIDIDL